MKATIAVIFFLQISFQTYCQWAGSTTTGGTINRQGKVFLNSSGWDDHLEITRGSWGAAFKPDGTTGYLGLRLELIGTGSNFYIPNGNVGIGNTNPTLGRLQVTQMADGSDYGIAINNSTGARAMRLWTDTNNSYVYSGGTGQSNLILNGPGSAGNVGIGITPTDKLHLNGDIRLSGSSRKVIVGSEWSISDYLLLQDVGSGTPALQWVQDGVAKFSIDGVTGNVGIGILPTDKLHLNGDIRLTGNSRKLIVGSEGSISDYLLLQDVGSGTPALQWVQDGVAKFSIDGVTGNVGIGTTTPDAKLAVKGLIHTQELNIDVNGAMVPDYVFEKTYDLKPLSEVETFITENKHLPEVPSATEMEKTGMDVKALNLLLMKKVEELTLYMIELKKENEKQNQQIQQLLNKKNIK
jgi:hypothetical protein